MNDVEILQNTIVRWWDYYHPLSGMALIPLVYLNHWCT